MAIEVYLNFNGNCREAVEFYTDVFQTEKPEIMTFGDSPPNPEYPLQDDAKNLVMHTRLNIKGSNVMFSDVFPGMKYVIGNNISLTVVTENIEETQSYFHKLKEGGEVGMELQETFWSKCYGNLTDQFGVVWQLSLGSGEAK